MEALDVSLEAIGVSILLAVAHAGIELIFIFLEKKANKTDFMHYTIICFNGRFGWVPFTNHFAKNDVDEEQEKYFNYDDISSSMCCLNFKLDYTFTDDTIQGLIKSLTVMPFETNPIKRQTIVVGDCLRNISFENFINLIVISNNRVNLDIMDVEMLKLSGVEDEMKKPDFLETLAKIKHPQLLPLVQKEGYKIEGD